MIIGLLEYSEGISDPEVFIGDTVVAVNQAIMEHVARFLPDEKNPDGRIRYIDRQWAKDNPPPLTGTDEEVSDWLLMLRDMTTDMWVTLYMEGVPQRSTDGPNDGTYFDLRASE